MKVGDFVYGIDTNFDESQFEVVKTRIVKVTPETIVVEDGLGCYGYSNRLRLVDDQKPIHQTEKEAIEAFWKSLMRRTRNAYGKH